MKNLNEMTSKELKELAKELKVKNWWSLSKAALIEEINKIQNASEEDKAAREEELRKEDELFNHYSKNWKKYGPKNDWTSFYKDFKAGKITLIEENAVEETTETPSEAPISQSEDVLEEPKQNTKAKAKKTNLKLVELTYKGETKSIKEWAAEIEMPWPTLYDRVNRNGWSVEEAIETPLGQRRAK